MRIREVFEKTLRRELSVAEAAEITGVAERDVVAWMRARRAGRGGLDEHRRKQLKGAASTQVQYAVALYRERYTSLSASEFARVLKSEHGIVLRGPGLYLALRKEASSRLVPSRPGGWLPRESPRTWRRLRLRRQARSRWQRMLRRQWTLCSESGASSRS